MYNSIEELQQAKERLQAITDEQSKLKKEQETIRKEISEYEEARNTEILSQAVGKYFMYNGRIGFFVHMVKDRHLGVKVIERGHACYCVVIRGDVEVVDNHCSVNVLAQSTNCLGFGHTVGIPFGKYSECTAAEFWEALV